MSEMFRALIMCCNVQDGETDIDHRNEKITAALICAKSFMVKYNLLKMRFPQRKYHFTFRRIVKVKRCYGTNEVWNVSHHIFWSLGLVGSVWSWIGGTLCLWPAAPHKSCWYWLGFEVKCYDNVSWFEELLFTGAASTLITAVRAGGGGYRGSNADAQLPGAAVVSGRSCEGQRTVIEAPVSQTQHACLSPSHRHGIDRYISGLVSLSICLLIYF